ncbi:hypothetical protein [Enterobacter asburiae]|nr:hypothetical protein [Enterobacter asburiae]
MNASPATILKLMQQYYFQWKHLQMCLQGNTEWHCCIESDRQHG